MTSTERFKLRLSKYLAENPDVKPSVLGVKAGKSDAYIRTLLRNSDQSPTLATAEDIAKNIGETLNSMISDNNVDKRVEEWAKAFCSLDEDAQERLMTLLSLELDQAKRS
ncbi:hypothetical protein [Celeribacter sp.]|uniref:hypothetical protein n=1 Tax=Celeribacter sp. TaxID=1890673 RepID=UPI003A8DF991